MRILLLLFLSIFILSFTVQARQYSERKYTNAYCLSVGGTSQPSETRTREGTYSDCLTATHVYELDFDNKLYECVSQARHYMRVTDHQGICVAIMEEDTATAWGRVYRIKNDEWMLPKEYRIPIIVITPQLLESQ